jgi:hypothetical protein
VVHAQSVAATALVAIVGPRVEQRSSVVWQTAGLSRIQPLRGLQILHICACSQR